MRVNGDKKKRFCVKGCGRLSAPKRTICNTCKNKIWVSKNPIKFLFNNLKKSAKVRQYPFTITIEYFTEFLHKEKYLERKRGRDADSVSIDRIKNELGYVPGNLKVEYKGYNSAKFHEERRQQKTELEKVNIYIHDGTDHDLPF